ncbi:MAG: hypothetical protein HQK84_11305 [Nitrospinae bacterium]|nr:hypothetical protein [Nitrospinota bacterium]
MARPDISFPEGNNAIEDNVFRTQEDLNNYNSRVQEKVEPYLTELENARLEAIQESFSKVLG